MADKHRRQAAIAALLVISWLVISFAGAGAAAVLSGMGGAGCEADPADAPVGFRDSNYGRMEWSSVPPGPHCVWTVEVNGFAASDRPSPIWTLWLLTVVVLGLLAWRQFIAALGPVAWRPFISALVSGASPSAPSPSRPPRPSIPPTPPRPATPPSET